jgi:methylmalonyl-CoA mutase N-terminal domain/subunit
MLRAIEIGFVQREIQEAAYRYQRAIETKDEVVVGVNKFQVQEERPVATLRIDPEIERAQIERVRAVRDRRDPAAVESALQSIGAAAETSENLLPHILRAVESYATVGEISNRLRSVWGEYRESATV